MKFIYRLGFFLGGFSIGLIILVFVLNQKNASCNYFPNDRVLHDIQKKSIVFEPETLEAIRLKQVDSLAIIQTIQHGDIDFGESQTKEKGCNRYLINHPDELMQISVRNCQTKAYISIVPKK
ncbi:MAG: hypothetical protein RQ735_00430 [Flavobacteriaceae bacterium]|nr:hypothetical protein [Flavobacteriaceae bacterium]